jgi:sugar phosphate isomerase/epimerase
MHISKVANPGIMLSQVWPKSRKKKGETLRALETVLEYGFFKAFQTVEIPFAAERKTIATLLEQRGVLLTYCLARILNENQLNLSDLDVQNRKKSYMKVIECLEHAKEAGAHTVSLISGPAPENNLRREALTAFEDSIAVICEKASRDYDIKIIIEPLDYSAHKKNTLGTTREAVSICKNLKSKGTFPYLCIDTAHVFLNGEQVVDAINLASAYTLECHFCNCVTDITHPFFGDHHIPFGKPGILGIEGIALIFKRFVEIGYLSTGKKPAIFCEVIKRPGDDSVNLMKYNQLVLETAWEQSGK